MGTLEKFIYSKYDLSNEKDREEIYALLDSVNSEEKAYTIFGCKYSKTNRIYLYKIGHVVGFDINIYKERRKCKPRFCLNCDKPLTGKYQIKFCSHKCAAEYNNKKREEMSEETKKKISKTLKISIENGKHKHAMRVKRICVVCGKEYLKNKIKYLSDESRKRISENGRKSVEKQGDARRSKNEIAFCKLCENYFSNVESNKCMFNGWDADVIIHDYKIAVLWNGAWHYKEISKKTSLTQIQNRDSIKIQEIRNYNYIPYIIKDMGRYSEQKVLDEFEKLKIFINKLNIAG